MKKRMFITLVCVVLVLGLVGGLSTVLAKGKPKSEPEPAPQVRIQADLLMPASMHMNATADGCLNHQGPEIRLVGDVNIGGVDSRLIFRNSVKGPHEVSVKEETDVVLLTDGGITFNKQPTSSLEGVGGNLWIFIEFSTKTWSSPEFLLGRCVQGLSPAFVDFSYLTTATVVVSAEG